MRKLFRSGPAWLVLATLAICAPVRPAVACVGDCAGDGAVTVDDLVNGVNILLGSLPVSRCPRVDRNGDGAVTIDELLAAVNAALGGCPVESATATPSAPPTATPSELPTATATDPLPTATATPSHTVTDTPTSTATEAPSATPTTTVPPEHPIFRDVTGEAGVDYLHFDVGSPVRLIGEPYYFSGGAAAGDYDGDGWVDLFVTRLDAPDILFRNRGDGTFEDVSAAAGFAAINRSTNGCAWGDVDNDGDLDLYVTTAGEFEDRFLFYINDGAGHFTEDAAARGVQRQGIDEHYGMSVAFGDYDRDGWLDLHTSEWRPIEYNLGRAPSNARLFHNRGAAAPGFFTDETDAAGVAFDAIPPTDPLSRGSFPFAARFVDMDDDGWSDLVVASDFGTSRLFWNNHDGTFTDGTLAAGLGSDENGMGSAIGDYDADGRPDWFITSIFDPDEACPAPNFPCHWGYSGNRLFRNLGGRQFADATDAAGVRDGYWGWGAAFIDYDNDADLDLIMTNGIDLPYLNEEMIRVTDRFRQDPMRVWRNDGGVMTEVSAAVGVTNTGSGKGLLTFDYDRDGDLDVFVVNNGGHPVLYRNDGGNRSGWLRVKVRGVDSNRDGIGARVTVRVTAAAIAQTREIEAGSHFLGQSEFAAHFGLGPGGAPVHEVRVDFPATGRTVLMQNVARNQVLAVTEPAEDPAFADVTAAAGLDYEHDYTDAIRDNFEVPEIMGGVAAGDYDADGWVDLFAVTGDHPNLLLRNTGGAFAVVDAPPLAMNGLRSSGPTFADVDGDGKLDLFVGVVEGGPPRLFRNLGTGFEDRTASSGLAGLGGDENLGAAFADYDRDGDLDLLMTHWGTRRFDGGDVAYLWRNNGDWTFTDVSVAAGLPHGNPPDFFDVTFTPNFVDIDSDGWLDLLVAADFTGSAVLRNLRDGRFGFARPAVFSDENGMGGAVGDYDNDGDLDWFVTSIFDHDGVPEGNWGVSGNRLYRNDGDGTFDDATDVAGVRDGYWGWAACFADLDNDGWLDLYHVNGWGRLDLGPEAVFTPGTEEFQDDPARLFLNNRDGSFREAAAELGAADRGQGRGLVCFDYDRDGDIDLLIANNGGRPTLLRNQIDSGNHYLAVRLSGKAPNTEAIGARVRITAGGLTQFRELRAGSNFLSQDPAIAHFGLGQATMVDTLEVQWPGLEQTTVLTDVAADQYLTVTQP